MKILPAIDLKDGRCVRLCQGRADDATIYSDSPTEMALKWQSLGAEFLHLVDLTGAFEGHPAHTEVIRDIAKHISIPFEVGGGLRTDADVLELLDAGASRVIIGSRAISDPAALGALVAKYGSERIAVGIDARDGFVQINGWVDTTTIKATELAVKMQELGVGTLIYTDTATDGMLKGPNLEAMAEMARTVPQMQVIASGGVKQPSDIKALAALGYENLTGVIVGKALYENMATLPEFLAAAK